MNHARCAPFTEGADLVSILEASYLRAADVEGWFDQLLEAFAQSGLSSQGFFGHMFVRNGQGMTFNAPRGSSDVAADHLECERLMHIGMSPEDLAKFYDCPPCTTLSHVTPAPRGAAFDFRERAELAAMLNANMRKHGIKDMVGLRAEDASGKGLLISTSLTEPKTFERREVSALCRVLAHVSAGLRLQLASTPPGTEGAEAILGAGGRLEHAEGVAKEPAARAALKQAANGVDRARGRLRRSDPEAATEEWKALVAGRWSLIDHFDHDGRRYLVARRNEQVPRRCTEPRLTLSERRVAALAALGRSNKLIAYELGLSPSGVSTYLSRISRKLGAASRVELVGAFANLPVASEERAG